MIILIIICTALILFLFLALKSHFSLDVTNYEIESEKISSDFKIVQLSDLHSREFRKNNKDIIKCIEKEKPDVIVMTGDMVNAKVGDMCKLEKFIKGINSICNIYYSIGNREFRYSKEEFENLLNMLKTNGVKVLNNKKETIYKAKSKINIYGINYNNRIEKQYYEFVLHFASNIKNEPKNSINDIFENIDKEEYNILLSHSPNSFEKYAMLGFDLVVSGHIHGGIVRLPFIGGLFSPNVTFFPKYDAGIYYEKNSMLCVNRGLGYGTLPFRILNNPEIVIINLKTKNSQN